MPICRQGWSDGSQDRNGRVIRHLSQAVARQALCLLGRLQSDGVYLRGGTVCTPLYTLYILGDLNRTDGPEQIQKM